MVRCKANLETYYQEPLFWLIISKESENSIIDLNYNFILEILLQIYLI
jgi:hypothetical protein